MDNIIITNARVDDIPTMRRWGEGNWQIWGSDTVRFYSEKELREWIGNPREDFVLVARDGETPVGMCIASMMRHWVYIDAFYVDEPYRKRGVGAKLLTEIRNRITGKDVVLEGLYCNIKNKHAREFYKKMGFTEGYTFVFMQRWVKES